MSANPDDLGGEVIDNPDRLDAARGLTLLVAGYVARPRGVVAPTRDLRALLHLALEGCEGLAVERADGPLPITLEAARDLWRREAAAMGWRL